MLVNLLLPLLLLRRTFLVFREGLKDPDYRAIFGAVLALLAIGTLFYHFVEGWSLIDAFYFSVITLTTVGYGDLAPTLPLSRLFTALYIILGLSTFAGFLQLTAQKQYEQRLPKHKRNQPADPPNA